MCTVFNIFLNISNRDQTKPQTSTHIFRLVRQEKTPFGSQKNYISTKLGEYILDENKFSSKFKVGEEYIGLIEFRPFVPEDANDAYEKATGIFGRAKLQNSTISRSCDIVCEIIQQKNEVEKWITNTMLQQSCDIHIEIVKWFETVPCKDVGMLSKGLIIGGVEFGTDAKKLIRESGISHLVAVSGFQVVLIVGILEWVFGKLAISRNKRLFLGVASILIFGFLVGFEPPILRAIIMTMMTYFALILGRRAPKNKILLYSAMIMLWANPWYIFSISFQLSFLATFAIINGNIKEFGGGIFSNFMELAWLNLRIYLQTLPVILSLNGNINPSSIVVNLFVAPLTVILTGLNILTLIPIIGEFFGFFAILFETILFRLLQLIQIGNVSLGFKKMLAFEMIVFYMALVFVFLGINYCNTLTKKKPGSEPEANF
jgi:ComEC/Rec2-related protein